MAGGPPAFPEGLPFVRPTFPNGEALRLELDSILESGMVTNGARVRELERRAAAYLGVRHCLAVASCTSGLMLLLRAADLSGDVIVPSFTFAATAHAVAWNGLRPVFADVDPGTLTLSAAAAGRGIGVRTSAILATHTFGTPCDVEGLADLARRHGIRLFFDAAHGFGSRRRNLPVGGFGDAEVFSLSPTKILVAAEGGIIATNDDLLAERCRIGRDYGNPGDYDSRFVGLNARMSELHAAVALASLEDIEERIERRGELAKRYTECLEAIPGISFPSVCPGDRSTFKDFTVLVEPTAFGCDAAELARALAAEGIQTKRYYVPPVHRQTAYRSWAGTKWNLPVTDAAAERVLTVPFWAAMTDDHVARVSEAVARIGGYVRMKAVPGLRRENTVDAP